MENPLPLKLIEEQELFEKLLICLQSQWQSQLQ